MVYDGFVFQLKPNETLLENLPAEHLGALEEEEEARSRHATPQRPGPPRLRVPSLACSDFTCAHHRRGGRTQPKWLPCIADALARAWPVSTGGGAGAARDELH